MGKNQKEKEGWKEKEKKGRKKEKERKKSQWTDLQYRWHTLESNTATTWEKKTFLRSKGLLLSMNSNSSQADKRRAQWLCLSQLTLILFQAKEADKHCDTACQRMLNKLLSSLRFHLLLPLSLCIPITQEEPVTRLLSTCSTWEHYSEQGECSISFVKWGKGDSCNRILKVWNQLWRWWLSQYLGGRSRSLALSLNSTCTT